MDMEVYKLCESLVHFIETAVMTIVAIVVFAMIMVILC